MAIAGQLLRELYWSFVLRSSLLVVQISNKPSVLSFLLPEIMCVSSVLLFGKTKDVCCCGHHTSSGLDVIAFGANISKYCPVDYRVRIMFVVDYSENNFFLDCARKRFK